MDSFRNGNTYSISYYFNDHTNHIKDIEAEANRALQNINSLYKEIMHTESHDDFEFETNVDSNESPSTSTSANNNKQCNSKTSINRFTKTSRMFYSRSQLPLTHCFDCHNQYYENSLTSRSISTEERVVCESKVEQSKESNVQNSKSSKQTLKITVPQPFKLSGFDEERLKAKQLRLAKLKEENEQRIEKELNVKVVSKPAPKHTHLRLYNKMVEKNERRKSERKEDCLQIIGTASKPKLLLQDEFSRYAVKPKPLPSESKNSFKATPVPKNILSNKVSEKIKNKEEIRKLLSAHRAEEMLKQSSSPISKKTISRSYSMIDLSHYTTNKEKNKNSKPDISAITNRLYTKKCKETMNNWNDKVMRYCYKENESKSNITISNNLTPQPERLLPFLYYPVRMSTAASLRSKQIRSEISARQKRDEHQTNAVSEIQQERHEDISRKLHKLIPDFDPDKEIGDKVKSYRESQINREEEYERELEEMMKRVSQQNLLIEREPKKGKKEDNLKHITYEEGSLRGVTYEEDNTSVLNSDIDNSDTNPLEENGGDSDPEQFTSKSYSR